MEHRIATREEWLDERAALLAQEKEFNKTRDALSAARRKLPWVPVEKDYLFDTENGEINLADMFKTHDQLVVYHFMFGTDWDEGCTSCSFWVDNLDGINAHLGARGTALALVSKGSLDKLHAYRDRMGWVLPWYSSANSDFSEDYQVTFPQADRDAGDVTYNYRKTKTGMSDMPGISVFAKDHGRVYHTYSTYSRGLDMLNGAYHILDLTPKGRNEADLPFSMGWLKRHDEY
jgi:predicted dithiol-disulfide oxidoreductase (DUF899 family)